MKLLDFDDEYPDGNYKGLTIQEVLDEDPAYLMELDPNDPPEPLWHYTPEVLTEATDKANEQWAMEAFDHNMRKND